MLFFEVDIHLDEWQRKSQTLITTSIILYPVLESFLFSAQLSPREVLYTAFTEATRQTPCAHSTTPSPDPDPPGHSQLVMQHRVLPMDQPSLTHHTERDGRAHHWEDNTRSSYATDGE